MSAIRLARAATGRDRIAEVRRRLPRPRRRPAGRRGLGPRHAGHPGQPGRDRGAGGGHVVVPLERPAAVERRAERGGDRLRALPGQHGPGPAGRRLPRSRCASAPTSTGALLIFDEVISGFRVARGGAQEREGVTPDLTRPRQGHRRRPAGGRLRRPARPDGADRAGGRRLPGRHPVGEPAGHGRRPGHAASCSTTTPTRASTALTASSSPRACAEAAAGRRAGPGRRTTGLLTALLQRARRCATTRSAKACDLDALRRLLPRACSTAASTCRPSQFEAWFPSLAHTDAHVERTLERGPRGVRGALMSVLAELVAARRPRARGPTRSPSPAPGRFDGARRATAAFVLEAVYEGYLLHYGEPRAVHRHGPDLRCSPATPSTRSAWRAWRRAATWRRWPSCPT